MGKKVGGFQGRKNDKVGGGIPFNSSQHTQVPDSLHFSVKGCFVQDILLLSWRGRLVATNLRSMAIADERSAVLLTFRQQYSQSAPSRKTPE